jgi:transglutaminase-like putative cysteine protease
VLILATLAVVTGVLVQYQTLLGRDAGVAMLGAMAALKFLELRSVRDAMVVVFLGYLLAMANLLFSQSLPMAGYLLGALVVLVAAQIMVQGQHGAVPASASLRLSARMLCQATPVALVLFVLFPRLPGPLWALPWDAHKGRTGLTDAMSPGAISRLSQSGEVAFRVRFAASEPAAGQLYWRGPVLEHYDGRTWTPAEEAVQGHLPASLRGTDLVDYTVILEPHGRRWLFALDLPAGVPPRAGITASFQVKRARPVDELLRYEMRSMLSYRTGALSAAERERNLQLPRIGNSRARELAGAWRDAYSSAEGRVAVALSLFREAPFYYTLAPPRLEDDVVDRFLFETRRGFCEHYAGSFVFLMRAAGVPARVVTGYQGGERNGLGDYLIVRQADAHAWAEVWLTGRGWTRVDPTAAVAPQRVERGLYAAVADAARLPFLARGGRSWLHQVALGWDYLDNAWNEWVLAYGPDRQRRFFSYLGLGAVGWRETVVAMSVCLGAVGGVFLGIHALLGCRRGLDPVARAYQRFCGKLGRRGLVRGHHEGPLDFAERVAGCRPELAAQVRLIAGLYAGLRFGRLVGADGVQRLRRLVREFKA